MPHREETKAKGAEEQGRLKRPYSPPRLTAYGDVEEVTRDIGGGSTDGKAGSRLGDGA